MDRCRCDYLYAYCYGKGGKLGKVLGPRALCQILNQELLRSKSVKQ